MEDLINWHQRKESQDRLVDTSIKKRHSRQNNFQSDLESGPTPSITPPFKKTQSQLIESEQQDEFIPAVQKRTNFFRSQTVKKRWNKLTNVLLTLARLKRSNVTKVIEDPVSLICFIY